MRTKQTQTRLVVAVLAVVFLALVVPAAVHVVAVFEQSVAAFNSQLSHGE